MYVLNFLSLEKLLLELLTTFIVGGGGCGGGCGRKKREAALLIASEDLHKCNNEELRLALLGVCSSTFQYNFYI